MKTKTSAKKNTNNVLAFAPKAKASKVNAKAQKPVALAKAA